MSESIITKRAIADSFKKIVAEKTFDKISISDITKSCGLNRQTFYYHFQDKYELLNWIYYNDGFIYAIDGITLENWDEKICLLLRLMKQEQTFYINTIKSAQNYFTDYLLEITTTLFEEAISELDIRKQVIQTERHFIAEFFAYGVCGMVLSWVKSGMKQKVEELAKNFKTIVEDSEKLIYRKFCENKK